MVDKIIKPAGLIELHSTRIRTSPGFGSGTGISLTYGLPLNWSIITARIYVGIFDIKTVL